MYVRNSIPKLDEDRFMEDDLKKAIHFVSQGDLIERVENELNIKEENLLEFSNLELYVCTYYSPRLFSCVVTL